MTQTNELIDSIEGSSSIKVKRGHVDSIVLFEVTENELDTIEAGSPNSLFLNFGIALISVGISFLVTILTVDLSGKIILFTVFLIVTLITIIAGVILIALWYKTRKSLDNVFKKIRGRAEA